MEFTTLDVLYYLGQFLNWLDVSGVGGYILTAFAGCLFFLAMLYGDAPEYWDPITCEYSLTEISYDGNVCQRI